MQTTPLADTLIDRLRGERTARPHVDPMLAGGLRAWLEDDLAPLVGDLDPMTPLVLTPRSLRGEAPAGEVPVRAVARGALVRCLLAERLLLGDVEHPMDDALSALEGTEGDHGLVAAIHNLDADGFAALAAEVAAHDEVLGRALPAVPGTWLPRLGVRMSVPLVGGRVLLVGTVDVLLGPPATTVASTCLLDVTTARLGEATAQRLGGLALLETLRSGAPPLRAAALSTATGDELVVDVDDAVLIAAVRRITTVVEGIRGPAR